MNVEVHRIENFVGARLTHYTYTAKVDGDGCGHWGHRTHAAAERCGAKLAARRGREGAVPS